MPDIENSAVYMYELRNLHRLSINTIIGSVLRNMFSERLRNADRRLIQRTMTSSKADAETQTLTLRIVGLGLGLLKGLWETQSASSTSRPSFRLPSRVSSVFLKLLMSCHKTTLSKMTSVAILPLPGLGLALHHTKGECKTPSGGGSNSNALKIISYFSFL